MKTRMKYGGGSKPPKNSKKALAYAAAQVLHEEMEEDVSVDKHRVVLTNDLKPRLRWTPILHQRFLRAVNQLGGSDKATPKNILRIMDVEGLTLFHLKSHLQKYRMSKVTEFEEDYPTREDQYKAIKALHLMAAQDPGATSITIPNAGPIEGYRVNEALMEQMEVRYEVNEAIRAQAEAQRKLDLQLQAEKNLQMSMDAQERYMNSMLAKAYEMCSNQTMNTTNSGIMGNTSFTNSYFDPTSYYSTPQDENATFPIFGKELPNFQPQGTGYSSESSRTSYGSTPANWSMGITSCSECNSRRARHMDSSIDPSVWYNNEAMAKYDFGYKNNNDFPGYFGNF